MTKSCFGFCRYCLGCKTIMPSIGYMRKNGKEHDDWETREFHKCCFEVLLKEYKIDQGIKRYGKENKVPNSRQIVAFYHEHNDQFTVDFFKSKK